ncbi:MAG: hypothetical protein C5B59_05335 [Bacteroidetes bacterium]|nr:MAG: hypothetical protein C5B59_05335 [Bacteroidota bacterium]
MNWQNIPTDQWIERFYDGRLLQIKMHTSNSLMEVNCKKDKLKYFLDYNIPLIPHSFCELNFLLN